MRVRSLHPWRVSYAEAVEIQKRLRRQILIEPLAGPVTLVAGTDVAYSRDTHRMFAAIVTVALPAFEVVETATSVTIARFPYIPGLFSFREVPPLIAAARRLRRRPDLVLLDGQGLAHPRRCGLACHAGMLLGLPSIGCAKSLLVGSHGPVGPDRGDSAPLIADGETIGMALRTRSGVKPVFVSVGHMVDLPSACDLVLRATGRYRIPEPIRLAHGLTRTLMRERDRAPARPVRRTYPDFVRTRAT